MHTLTAMQDAALSVAARHHHHAALAAQWKHLAANSPGTALMIVIAIAALIGVACWITRSS